MATLRQHLAEASAALAQAAVPEPRLTAEILLAHLLGRGRSYLYAHPEEEISAAPFLALIEARAAGTPLQYLTGRQEFFGRSFAVSPAVLIPRPETELTVAAALERLPPDRPARVLDVGTGSGCIAVTLALERPAASVFATDISSAALALARANAAALGAAVAFALADLLAGWRGPFDVIVSNPPYVAETELAALRPEVRDHEPRLALVAGPRGTEIYARLIPQAAAALRPGGWLVLELGYSAAAAVRELLGAGWTQVATQSDSLGWERVLTARRL